MTRFADPARCPDCHAGIPPRAQRCPACGLSLSGALPAQLFATLLQADAILAQMRQARQQAPQQVPQHAPLAPPAPMPHQQYPRSRQPHPQGAATPRPTGLSSAHIPRILLGLGALCLVVAALIFLAVTWSALGVAGRTAIVLALAAGAFAGAQAFARKPLPAATETFTVLGLAFAGLGLAGAANAGWLPEMGAGAFTATLGLLLAGLGLATAEAARRVPGAILYSGELALGVGVAAAAIGAAVTAPGRHELVLVCAVVVAAGVAVASSRTLDTFRRILFRILGAATWLVLAVGGLHRAIEHPGADQLWAQGHVWPLLAAAALAAGVAAAPRLRIPIPLPRPARLTAATVAAALAWIAVWLPISAIDSVSVAVTATLAPLLLAAAAVFVAAPRWRVVPGVLLALSAIAPAVGALVLGVSALGRVETFEPLTAAFDARFPATTVTLAPLLLPPLTAALLLAAAVAARRLANPQNTKNTKTPQTAQTARTPWTCWAIPAAAALALTIPATIALLPSPVALVVGLPLALGAGLAVWALVSGRAPLLWPAAAALALALWWSVPGPWFLAISLLVVAALAAAATLAPGLRGRSLRHAADALAPVALAGALWLFADLAGLSPGAGALIVIVVLGALVIARPGVTGEIAAASAAIVAVVGAAQLTLADQAGSAALNWLAIHLTAGGALVGVQALRSPGRRRLGWVAAAILLLASWIRLAEIGVSAPEAYTLPAALVLLAAGLWTLRTRPAQRTRDALSAGLLLALVPSLLWSLADPVSLRALLLGIACAALVLAGAQLSWGAPLLYGAVTGSILALREAAPWAAQVNPWIATAAIGLVLTGVGVTWERRVQEIRRSRGYLARLR